MNKPFICTSDEQTAEYFRNKGYKEIPKQNGKWMFVNDFDKMIFDDDKLRYTYVDRLSI